MDTSVAAAFPNAKVIRASRSVRSCTEIHPRGMPASVPAGRRNTMKELSREPSPPSPSSVRRSRAGGIPSLTSGMVTPSLCSGSPRSPGAESKSGSRLTMRRQGVLQVPDTTTAATVDTQSEKPAVGADPFGRLLKQLEQEHYGQLKQMQDEIGELSERLDTVLTSTWNFGDDGWSAQAPGAKDRPDLKLVRRHSKEARTSAIWNVDAEVGDRMKDKLCYNLRQHWKDSHEASDRRKSIVGGPALTTLYSSAGEEDGGSSCLQRLVMHPYGKMRLAWDVASMLFLVWDLVMVPILAFDPEETVATVAVEWSTLGFWTLDILVAFLTGYRSGGGMVLDSGRIAKHYLQTRFFFDCLVVVPDWTFKVLRLAGIGGNTRASKLISILRFVRIAKLLAFWNMVKDRIESDLVFVVPRILQLVTIILMMGHFLGCLWYLIGTIASGQEVYNWIQASRLENEAIGFRYFTSLQWCLSNFALVNTDVQPQNSGERVFAIIVMLFGMLTFLWGVSVVTSSLSELKAQRGDTAKEFWLLRRYLRQQDVPPALTLRVLHYAEVACKEQMKLVPEARVALLPLLSEQLRNELKIAVCYAEVFDHPLFELANQKSKKIAGLANGALTRKSYGEGEVVYMRHSPASAMLYVISGELHYVQGEIIREVTKSDWLCEAILWASSWMHKGHANATVGSELIRIAPSALADVVTAEPQLSAMMSTYAESYIEWLNSQEADSLIDIGDTAVVLKFLHKNDRGGRKLAQDASASLSIDNPRVFDVVKNSDERSEKSGESLLSTHERKVHVQSKANGSRKKA
eukprot:TRINITY_DN18656_c0_g1_i1.p1 TRINITY_DN18656_c0_g1~~TRINITY_DN18656_c0_g1_i1.p1  ORF type:complete len:845 (+),score=93.31 TRINITY_DN18656_c0_g1_i1:132-2537(+)